MARMASFMDIIDCVSDPLSNKTLFVYKPSFKGYEKDMFGLVLVYNINKQIIRAGAVDARMRSLESVLRSVKGQNKT